jgi:TetR/AcrR family transcriptional repressor of nem operon
MDTRERLITSTQTLLWERGYVGPSPRAIQQHSGVGQGSMYHHFSGKADLALAAILRCAEQIREYAEQCLSAPGTPLERIESFLLNQRKVLQGCQLGRLTQDPEIIANPELHQPVGATFDWLQNRLSQVIAEGQANGTLDPELDSLDAAAALAGVMQGGYVLARAAGDDTPYYSAVRGMLTLLKTTRPATDQCKK